VGAVSQPVKTEGAAVVLRVDKRVASDSSAWAAQKQAQRTARLQQLRDQRIQIYMSDLRKSAKVDDRRKQINASVRRQEA
jgi:parvulin-like peptidyl-prolyl isomerase